MQQNAGPWNENSLVGVPSEVKTGEQYGAGQKVNVCKFTLGSVNPWDVRPILLNVSKCCSIRWNEVHNTAGCQRTAWDAFIVLQSLASFQDCKRMTRKVEQKVRQNSTGADPFTSLRPT